MARQLVVALLVLLTLSCSHMPYTFLTKPQLEHLTDGVFTGEVDKGLDQARVRVTVKDGRIHSLEVLSVLAFGWRQEAVRAKFPRWVVRAQSLAVDAVSGATGSCHALTIATDRALSKSIKPQ